MGAERPSLGFGGELESFDPAEWGRAPAPARPPAAVARQAADASGFHSREPAPAVAAPAFQASSFQPTAAPGAAPRPLRRRRTGRNAQFNIKARPDTIEAFCAVADLNGWGLGETLEHAVAFLQERHGRHPKA